MDKSVTKIPCDLKTFFRYWLLFLQPLHNLPPKEIEVLSYILKKRYELSKFIVDDSKIDTFLFSKDIREEIISENNITKNTLQVSLTNLRKAAILLEGDKIHKRFIPPLTKDSTRFDLMLLFEITDNAESES